MPSSPMRLSSANDSASPRRISSRPLDPKHLRASRFSLSLYGDPAKEVDDLKESIRAHGILVPLVVAPGTGSRLGRSSPDTGGSPVRGPGAEGGSLPGPPPAAEQLGGSAILEYNRQRRKTFSQLMREADALEDLWGWKARTDGWPTCGERLGAGIRDQAASVVECRDSDDRAARGDVGEAETGGSRSHRYGDRPAPRHGRQGCLPAGPGDLAAGSSGDARAQSGVAQLDAGTKTIHAAYKDLRRRDRFASDFRPTPYDVWPFRHDRAFGIPHPGSIPPALVAHALHYYTPPGALVVDPMAGGGTTLDVCQSMGRRCLAYDLHPTRPEIQPHDIRLGFPPVAIGCDLIFCDPPYHTMLARHYACDSIAVAPLTGWIAFLHELARHAFATLRPGGYLALLLAAQTEKDLPAGFGYLDHAFLGYAAARARASCPSGGSVARWTAPTCPSRFAAPATTAACSARCATCLVCASHSENRECMPIIPSARIRGSGRHRRPWMVQCLPYATHPVTGTGADQTRCPVAIMTPAGSGNDCPTPASMPRQQARRDSLVNWLDGSDRCGSPQASS